MGTFNITIQIANLNGERFEDVEAMADTGAVTTIIPRPILAGLGITPTRRETFQYAGGEQVQLDMAEARVRVSERETNHLGHIRRGRNVAPAGRVHAGRGIPGR